MNLHDILQNAKYYAITEYSVLFCYSAEYSVVLVQNIRLWPNIENPVSVEPYEAKIALPYRVILGWVDPQIKVNLTQVLGQMNPPVQAGY